MSSRHPGHIAEYLRGQARAAATALILAGGAPVIAPGTAGAALTDAIDIIAVFDGGGAVLAVGRQVDIVVDLACTIEAWAMVADLSTTSRVDVWRDAFAAYPPVAGDSMPGAAADRPQITAGLAARSDIVTAWDRVIIDAGDVLRFNLDTNNNATRITVALKARRAT
jgi:hypothetical protein